jgi:hypothetical protein
MVKMPVPMTRDPIGVAGHKEGNRRIMKGFRGLFA